MVGVAEAMNRDTEQHWMRDTQRARRAAPGPVAPLRIGEQPREGLSKYRVFDLRRRRAQIAARHRLA